MGYYLQIGEQISEPLASNAGWSDVIDWSQGLDSLEFGELRHLAEYGWCQDVPRLLLQIGRAIDKCPPDSDSTHTMEVLADNLRLFSNAGVVSVSDGLGEDDDNDSE